MMTEIENKRMREMVAEYNKQYFPDTDRNNPWQSFVHLTMLDNPRQLAMQEIKCIIEEIDGMNPYDQEQFLRRIAILALIALGEGGERD